MDSLGERPGFPQVSSSGDRDQRQQRDVRAAALDGIQQRLILQVADEDVLLVLRQRLVIDAIAGDVSFFRAPEEGELLFDQFFEDFMLCWSKRATFTDWPKNIGSLQLVVLV